MNVLTLPDIIGYVGVALLIGAYAGLQAGRLRSDAPSYSVLNALAAILLLVSLLYKMNPASFVIEIFWLGISLYGLWRSLRLRRERSAGQRGGAPAE